LSEPENYRRLALETRERAAAQSGDLREVLLRVAETYDAMARVQKTFDHSAGDHPPEPDEPTTAHDEPKTEH